MVAWEKDSELGINATLNENGHALESIVSSIAMSVKGDRVSICDGAGWMTLSCIDAGKSPDMG